MSLSPINAVPPDLANANTATVDRLAVLKDQRYNAWSAAAFDQSPKGLIKPCIAQLWRKGLRQRDGIQRDCYRSCPNQSDDKTT